MGREKNLEVDVLSGSEEEELDIKFIGPLSSRMKNLEKVKCHLHQSQLTCSSIARWDHYHLIEL